MAEAKKRMTAEGLGDLAPIRGEHVKSATRGGYGVGKLGGRVGTGVTLCAGGGILGVIGGVVMGSLRVASECLPESMREQIDSWGRRPAEPVGALEAEYEDPYADPSVRGGA